MPVLAVVTGAASEAVEIADTRARLDDVFWQKYTRQDPAFLRPAEVDHLLGDSSKAQRVLGWKPEIPVTQGVTQLCDWVAENRALF